MTTVSSATSGTSALSDYLAAQKTAATADTATTSKSSNTSSWQTVTGDFNTFLKILTTQLQNQDPTAATDTNQFTQELVQFAQVEQQISSNDKLSTLVDQGTLAATQSMLGFVGAYVEVPTENEMAVQNGIGSIAYTLPSAAESVSIKVYNSDGDLVTTMDGATKAGVNRIIWDGSISDTETASDGVYTFKLTALGTDGKSITATDTKYIGKVTGMTIDATAGNKLNIGTLSVDSSDVTAVFSSLVS